MPAVMQRQFRERAKRIGKMEVVTFDAHLEVLIDGAVGVVAMAATTRSARSLARQARDPDPARQAAARAAVARAAGRRAGARPMLDPEGAHDPA
jgi:hypothetical protein